MPVVIKAETVEVASESDGEEMVMAESGDESSEMMQMASDHSSRNSLINLDHQSDQSYMIRESVGMTSSEKGSSSFNKSTAAGEKSMEMSHSTRELAKKLSESVEKNDADGTGKAYSTSGGNIERFKTLRIDEVPEHDDSDDDAFLGKTSFVKSEKTPANIEEHLVAKDENMLHFKALAKYYGVTSSIAKLPDKVWQATRSKFTVATPDAQVQSISSTQMDKHLFIKFLVDELTRVSAELLSHKEKVIQSEMAGQMEAI